MLLHEKIRDAYVHPQFIADVIKPLQIEQVMDQEVRRLVIRACIIYFCCQQHKLFGKEFRWISSAPYVNQLPFSNHVTVS